MDSWKNQLYEAISTCTPHISIYDLSVEPGTVFAWKKKRGELSLPEHDLAAEMMDITNEIVSIAGLSRYEISNYAKPGHASRHNRVYWSGRGWWAFGQGSTSAPWGKRFNRPRTREGYRDWLENQKYEGLDHSLLEKNALNIPFDERVIVGLRTREGVDLEEIVKRLGWNDEDSSVFLNELKLRLKPSLEAGLIKWQGRRLQLSCPLGMALSNKVLVDFLLWWNDLPQNADA